MCDDPNLGMPQSLVDAIDSDPIFIDNEALTEIELDGEGVLDILLRTTRLHLQAEFKAKRISGAEYTKAFTALYQSCIQASVEFLLRREQSKWEAINAQAQAYATKAQILQTCSQTKLIAEQTRAQEYQTDFIMPEQKLATHAQAEATNAQYADNTLGNYTIGPDGLPTLPLTGSVPVKGVLGKQKELYTEQTNSYVKDAMNKAAETAINGWTTAKTINEFVNSPGAFDYKTLNKVMNELLAKAEYSNSVKVVDDSKTSVSSGD